MDVRHLQVLGRGANGSTSVGLSLPKGELKIDGLIDEDGEPVGVPLVVSRSGPGCWRVRAYELEKWAADGALTHDPERGEEQEAEPPTLLRDLPADSVEAGRADRRGD